MIANLDFTYPKEEAEFEWPMQKNEPRLVAPSSEAYDLPAQVEFQLAAAPQLLQESPAPLQFSRLKEATKVPRGKGKPTLYPATVKSKFSGFSGIPKKSLQKLAMLKKHAKKPPQPQAQSPRKEWNEDVKTPGLFDTKLTKKAPVQVLHQSKSARRSSSVKKDAQPKVFREWNEMKTGEELQGEGEPLSRTVQLKDNLEFKFVEDQEALVRKLELQLAQEKNARKALDRQFAERMKELEQLKDMDKKIEVAKKQYLERRKTEEKKVTIAPEADRKGATPAVKSDSRRVSANAKATLRPAVLSPSVQPPRPITGSHLQSQIETMKKSVSEAAGEVIDFPISGVQPDLRFGNIHEEPTHDEPPAPTHAQSLKPAVYHPVIPSDAILSEVREAIQDRQPTPDLREKVARVKPLAVQSLPRNEKKEAFLTALSHKVDLAEKYGLGEKTLGIVSKVSARYVAYYADDLTALLVDDLLADTVMELQRIEECVGARTKQQIRVEANTMLDSLVSEFTDRVKVVQGKWVERPKPIPGSEVAIAPPILIEDRRRLWETGISDKDMRRIRDYKREYEEYTRRQSGGSRLWEIYAKVGDQLLSEVLDSALSDFDEALGEFTEHVISEELA